MVVHPCIVTVGKGEAGATRVGAGVGHGVRTPEGNRGRLPIVVEVPGRTADVRFVL